MVEITYRSDYRPTVEEFRSILERSTLAERRPVDNASTLAGMLDKANLITTAWDGSVLVGIGRSLTDFVYCCYLSDLAVDRDYQKQGIGRRLITETFRNLGDSCTLILLAAPAAVDYYGKVGMHRHPAAYTACSADMVSG